ncbi:hypothetical protein ACEN2P_03685 [Pedobacter psychrotolerans]|uniref:hypothetical protein n=1 Tax=Pedobacter psychrotolerans TaxID=1843235 RepID=UPI003F958835
MYANLSNPGKSFQVKRFLKIIAFLSSAFLLATGCQDTKSRMTDFVTAYNKEAAYVSSQFVRSTSAKADYRQRIIQIRVVTTYNLNDTENEFIKQVMPGMMMDLLKSQPLAKKLIEAGIKFEITYFTQSLSEISVVTIDKKKLEELDKVKSNSLNEPGFNNPGKNEPANQLDMMLVTLNKSLPFTDKSSGMIIFKVDQNSMGDLVYHVHTPKALEAPVKTKAGIELMRSEMLRYGNLQKNMHEFSRFNISAIKYVYYDLKGKKLNEVRLTAADIQQ